MKIRNYFKATSLEMAYEKLLEDKSNTILGGGAMLRLSKKDVHTAIDLELLNMNQIIEHDDFVEIGAMTSLRTIEENPHIKALYNGILSKALKVIMGVGIRNLATIGGSVAGKYAFSDIMTPLLAMRAQVKLYQGGVMDLETYMKYREKDIIESILIPKSNGVGYFYKMANSSLDFALVNVSITQTNGLVNIAVGARPSLAHCIYDLEVTTNEIEKFVDSVIDEFKFSSNSKASKEYRKELAKVYIKRGILEVQK